MENYYKFFKDDAVEDDGDEDRETLSRDMKDILGDADGLEQLLLAASAEGFRHLISTASAPETRGSYPHDAAYDDDEEEYEAGEYMAYTCVRQELFIAESSE